MAKSDDNMEQFFNLWKEGQETFLKTQQELYDGFQGALQGASDAGASSMDDPVKTWQKMVALWAPQFENFAAQFDAPIDGNAFFNKGRDAIFAMMDPAHWNKIIPEQLRGILETVAQGPRFADLATPQIDAAHSWRETLDYQTASADLAKVLQGAWGRAYQKFSEDYSLNDLQSGGTDEALEAWLACANKELLDTQRAPEFMDAQRRMIRASMEIKARQRDLAEAWSENYQIPTRSEVDDLTKIVHELRRELRQVKRDLANVRSEKSK